MRRAAHQRSKDRIPTEHDRAESRHLDSLREIEPHEGFVAANARVRQSIARDTRGAGSRSRATVIKWPSKPCRSLHRTTAPDTTLPATKDTSVKDLLKTGGDDVDFYRHLSDDPTILPGGMPFAV